jgi:hypothetical protein
MFIFSNPPLFPYDYRIQAFFSGRNPQNVHKYAPGKSYPPSTKTDFYDLQICSMDERATRVLPERYIEATGIENRS